MSDPNQQYYEYLDGVRDSGGVNMYAAGSLLREAYGLNKREAQIIALEWMRANQKKLEQCESST